MSPDLHSWNRLLRSCAGHSSISLGKQIHSLLIKEGSISSLFHSNRILQSYARCTSNAALADARQLFDEMPHRNCFSYNTLLDAYFKANDSKSSLQLFDAMIEKNEFSWNTMVTGLVKFGDIGNARKVFDDMPKRDVIACNSMIHGYIQCGQVQEAFKLYKKLDFDSPSPCNDNFVMATMLSACADCLLYRYGKQIHSRILVHRIEVDSVLGSSLVNMYGKCGDLDDAHRALELMKEPDEFSLSALLTGYAGNGRLVDARMVFDCKTNPGVVLWNSMINGYVSNYQGEEALHLFIRMIRAGIRGDFSTLASVLSACVSTGMLNNGKQLHGFASKLGFLQDIVVASALLDVYSKFGCWENACMIFRDIRVHDTILLNSMINVYANCGRIEDSRQVFEMIPSKSLISWNSMIVGYSQNGYAVEALQLFCEMHRVDLRPDKVALASAISAAASVCCLALGEEIFTLVTVLGLVSDQIISTSLVDLYCKCGRVSDGRRLFDSMIKFDEAPWNSMLMGYSMNGYGIEVLRLFEDMRNAGVLPNEVSFIAVLSGCCHCGILEEGLKWFQTMKEEYGIVPVAEHYSCMVDLLVRSGQLEEAVNFIEQMPFPFEGDASVWTSVLGGCKAQGDEFLAGKVAKKLMELNSSESGPYLQLSGVYASHGEWERSALIRRMMQKKRINKNPGYSWIDN
ncbi:TPR-like protein [Dioscorea alata]|uniref:TPR-like protein n=1 Tax=Dioscorea alata TaxID=55571 RepID=A0ACB7WBU2_DIOAL|nr:TPR-like protein [Dioscorea alata]